MKVSFKYIIIKWLSSISLRIVTLYYHSHYKIVHYRGRIDFNKLKKTLLKWKQIQLICSLSPISGIENVQTDGNNSVIPVTRFLQGIRRLCFDDHAPRMKSARIMHRLTTISIPLSGGTFAEQRFDSTPRSTETLDNYLDRKKFK